MKGESEERGRQVGERLLWEIWGSVGGPRACWGSDKMAPATPLQPLPQQPSWVHFERTGRMGYCLHVGETKTLDKAGNGVTRMGPNCQAHFPETEFGVTVGSCGRLWEERGKEGEEDL